ncbi:hypothetical protein ACLKA7_000332 [Drosophila subpalustris]
MKAQRATKNVEQQQQQQQQQQQVDRRTDRQPWGSSSLLLQVQQLRSPQKKRAQLELKLKLDLETETEMELQLRPVNFSSKQQQNEKLLHKLA